MDAEGNNKRKVRLVRKNTAHQAVGFGSDRLDGLNHTYIDAVRKGLRKSHRDGNQMSIANNERDDRPQNIAARMGIVERASLHVMDSRARVNIAQMKYCKPLDLAAASGRINTAPMLVIDRNSKVDVEKHNGDRTPDHFTLFKSIVEACFAGDTTALPRYPPDHPRHAETECLYRFYNKPNAPTVADFFDIMQTYTDDVLIHTSTATKYNNFLLAIMNCKFVHQHIDLYNLANNAFLEMKGNVIET